MFADTEVESLYSALVSAETRWAVVGLEGPRKDFRLADRSHKDFAFLVNPVGD